MGKVVGIDLGTTFSAVAHVNEHAQPEILPNAESDRITPSVIMYEDDLVTVGKVAKQNASAVPEQIVEFVKREMGKSNIKYNLDQTLEVTSVGPGRWPFNDRRWTKRKSRKPPRLEVE